MKFIRKLINSKKTYTIVDIGTYKIRCNIVEISKDSIKILGYGEKKQEPGDFYFGELQNLENIAKNLGIALKKAEKEAGEQTKSIIVNSATFKVFFSRHNIEYERETSGVIKKAEMKKIMAHLLFSLKNTDKPLQSGVFWTKDMKLVLASIRELYIDNKLKKNLLLQTGGKIKLSLNQFFVQSGKYELIKKLSARVGKKLELLLPYEHTMKELIYEVDKKEDYLIVNIGNARTSLVVVRGNNILVNSYFNIGIGELIDTVSENYKITHFRAIKTIDERNSYIDEKEEFYDIWESAFKICLDDMLGNNICPYDFYMFGGGYNSFMAERLGKISWANSGIKMEKSAEFNMISTNGLAIDGKFQLDVKSNVSLVSMLIATQNYYKNSSNEMVHMIQKMIQN